MNFKIYKKTEEGLQYILVHHTKIASNLFKQLNPKKKFVRQGLDISRKISINIYCTFKEEKHNLVVHAHLYHMLLRLLRSI